MIMLQQPVSACKSGRSGKTQVTVGDVLTNKFEHLTVAEEEVGEVSMSETTEA